MKKESCATRLRYALNLRNIKHSELSSKTKIPKSAISQYLSGAFEPKQDRVELLAKVLNVSEAWLMGFDVPMDKGALYSPEKYPAPEITDDFITFPVIGEIAAGYDHIAIESWDGDQIEIPRSYLKGRNPSEFMVLSVKGDSMYPRYLENDKVMILKQTTVNYSGQIGAVLYNDNYATLKKVEYRNGEDWLRLVPINPVFPPAMIQNEDLNHCRIIGTPWLLIRDETE